MALPETVLTGVMALAFCAVHIFVGRLKFLAAEPRSAWLSFAGGVAVAYVFMHLLPEMGAHGSAFSSSLNMSEKAAESLVHALALAGLALFYGTERALASSRKERREREGRDRPDRRVFWLHVGASGLLIFIIGYLLNHREDDTPGGLGLFFLAMILHFLTADFGARSEHPELYDQRGRWALCAATLGGWLTGTVLSLHPLAIAGLFAFVGGGVVLLVMKEELPQDRKSRFGPFLIGAVLYSSLVLGELYLSG